VPDNVYDDPRLAAIYDPLDPDRSDLDAYLAILTKLGAGSVLDVGCGTGTFAALLADRGLRVFGVDPGPGLARHRAHEEPERDLDPRQRDPVAAARGRRGHDDRQRRAGLPD
jgi:SAM-dependent methyltransferase